MFEIGAHGTIEEKSQFITQKDIWRVIDVVGGWGEMFILLKCHFSKSDQVLNMERYQGGTHYF